MNGADFASRKTFMVILCDKCHKSVLETISMISMHGYLKEMIYGITLNGQFIIYCEEYLHYLFKYIIHYLWQQNSPLLSFILKQTTILR